MDFKLPTKKIQSIEKQKRGDERSPNHDQHQHGDKRQQKKKKPERGLKQLAPETNKESKNILPLDPCEYYPPQNQRPLLNEPKTYNVFNPAGDGNCMWLAYLLTEEFNKHALILRQQTLQRMKEDDDIFKFYEGYHGNEKTGILSKDAYIQHFSREGLPFSKRI